MSGYEVEHNISQDKQPEQPQRRPDLSTFFSTLELVDTSNPETHHNVHATPQPENMAAAYRLLANAFEMMGGRGADERGAQPGHEDLLDVMIETLRQNADNPPSELPGVPDSFIEELDRIPKKKLKDTDVCAICHDPYLKDPYPLVVVLPCKGRHRFCLECVIPWLKLQPSCPLDREVIWKKKQPTPPPIEDDDEEYDDMYA